ncbi:hypothetical protein ACH4SP_05635 [Streptomyces sp. NPDC021093]|uniref:hypothetical protein n=1 Tax=Streptomyces sp. NPDC021093 TaxID=3365112 RepID=UPI0037A5E501
MYGSTGAAANGAGPGGPGAQPAAVNRLVVFGDVCGSGSMGLETKKRMREAMYAAFGEAFAVVGVPPGRLHQEDRGDGILAALPADVPSSLMVGRWLSTVYENLREHNHGRSDRLRMRVGMHVGPVLDDGRGLVGRAVDLTCRLCDSDTAKRVMEAAPESALMLVVSEWLYANVVADGGRYIEPQQYLSGRVRAKETDETAWFHVPGLEAPSVEAVSGPGVPTAAKQAAEPGRGGGTWEGDGPPPPGARGPQVGSVAQEFHVGGDNLSVTGSTIHGGFTGIRKEGTRRREREREPEREPRREPGPRGEPVRGPVGSEGDGGGAAFDDPPAPVPADPASGPAPGPASASGPASGPAPASAPADDAHRSGT